MKISSVDKKQRKNALKKLQKKTVKQSHGVIRISYYGSRVLTVLAIVIGAVSAYNVSQREHYAFEFLMPFLYFAITIGISLMVAAIYKGAAGKDYMLRRGEKLSFDGKTYYYSYEDRIRQDSADTSRFIISKADITRLEYDKDTREITLHGKIIEERYNKDNLVLTNEWAKLVLIDTFKDLDLYNALK